jgi:hypothetical protein
VKASTATGPPLLERKREILAGLAKGRQIRKPADSVVENLPPQTDKTRDAVAAELGDGLRGEMPPHHPQNAKCNTCLTCCFKQGLGYYRMTELRVHLPRYHARDNDRPMQRRKPSLAQAHVRHDHHERFAGSAAELAASAAGEIERGIIKGKPLALALEPGERPGILSPKLRLLARAAQADLARLAELGRYTRCRKAEG